MAAHLGRISGGGRPDGQSSKQRSTQPRACAAVTPFPVRAIGTGSALWSVRPSRSPVKGRAERARAPPHRPPASTGGSAAISPSFVKLRQAVSGPSLQTVESLRRGIGHASNRQSGERERSRGVKSRRKTGKICTGSGAGTAPPGLREACGSGSRQPSSCRGRRRRFPAGGGPTQPSPLR